MTSLEKHRDTRLRGMLSDDSSQDFNLAEAALLLAADEYPELDVEVYLNRIDEMVEKLRDRLPNETDEETTLSVLNEFLFDELGFVGNSDDYYDPRNSFLNEVLDRRQGIPITLSILYMELAQRLGIALEGVAFPWHFLVKLQTQEGDLVLDPYAGGICLSEEDLVERLAINSNDDPDSLVSLVRRLVAQPTDKKQILARMLRNLKEIYLKKEDWPKTLRVLHRLLLIAPQNAKDLKERAALYDKLECHSSALTDYRRYLSLVSTIDDETVAVRQRVLDLQRQVLQLH